MARAPSAERRGEVFPLRELVRSNEPFSLRALQETYRGREEEIRRQLGGTFLATAMREGPEIAKRARKIYHFFKAPKEDQHRILEEEDRANAPNHSLVHTPERDNSAFSVRSRIELQTFLTELTELDTKVRQQIKDKQELQAYQEDTIEALIERVEQRLALDTKPPVDKNRIPTTLRSYEPVKNTPLGIRLSHAITNLQRSLQTHRSLLSMSKRTREAVAPSLDRPLKLTEAEALLNGMLDSRKAVSLEDVAKVAKDHPKELKNLAAMRKMQSGKLSGGNENVANRATIAYDFLNASDERKARMIADGITLATVKDTPRGDAPKKETRKAEAKGSGRATKEKEAAPIDRVLSENLRDLRKLLNTKDALSFRQICGELDGRDPVALNAALRQLIADTAADGQKTLEKNARALRTFLDLPYKEQIEQRRGEVLNELQKTPDTKENVEKTKRLTRENGYLLGLGVAHEEAQQLANKHNPAIDKPRSSRHSTSRTSGTNLVELLDQDQGRIWELADDTSKRFGDIKAKERAALDEYTRSYGKSSDPKTGKGSDNDAADTLMNDASIFDRPEADILPQPRRLLPDFARRSLTEDRSPFTQTKKPHRDLAPTNPRYNVSPEADAAFEDRFVDRMDSLLPEPDTSTNSGGDAFDNLSFDTPRDWLEQFGSSQKSGSADAKSHVLFPTDQNPLFQLGTRRGASDTTQDTASVNIPRDWASKFGPRSKDGVDQPVRRPAIFPTDTSSLLRSGARPAPVVTESRRQEPLDKVIRGSSEEARAQDQPVASRKPLDLRPMPSLRRQRDLANLDWEPKPARGASAPEKTTTSELDAMLREVVEPVTSPASKKVETGASADLLRAKIDRIDRIMREKAPAAKARSLEQTRRDLADLRARAEALQSNPVAAPEAVRSAPVIPTRPESAPRVEPVAVAEAVTTVEPAPFRPTPRPLTAGRIRHTDLLAKNQTLEDQLQHASLQSAFYLEQAMNLEKALAKATDDETKNRLNAELVQINDTVSQVLSREYVLRTGNHTAMAAHLDQLLDAEEKIGRDPIGRLVLERIHAVEAAGEVFDLDDANAIQDTAERALALRVLELRYAANPKTVGMERLREYHLAELRHTALRSHLLEKCVTCHLPEDQKEALMSNMSLVEKRELVDHILQDPQALDNPQEFWDKAAKKFIGILRALRIDGIPFTTPRRRVGSSELHRIVTRIETDQRSLDAFGRKRDELRNHLPTGAVVEARTQVARSRNGDPLESPASASSTNEIYGELNTVWRDSDTLIKDLAAFTETLTDESTARFNARLSLLEGKIAAFKEAGVPDSVRSMHNVAVTKLEEAQALFTRLREVAAAQSPDRLHVAPGSTENVPSGEETERTLNEIYRDADDLRNEVMVAMNRNQNLSPEAFRDIDHRTIVLSTRLRNMRDQKDTLSYKLADNQLKALNTTLDEYEERVGEGNVFDQRQPLELLLKNAIEAGVSNLRDRAPERAALRQALLELNDGIGVRIDRVDDVEDVMRTFLRRYTQMDPVEQRLLAKPFNKALDLLGMANIYDQVGLESLDALAARVSAISPATLGAEAPANDDDIDLSGVPRINVNKDQAPDDDFDLAA